MARCLYSGGGNVLKQPNLDLDRPDGADHDRNTYCYRLKDGVMTLRGIILGTVIGEFEPRKLSCYKEREDIEMAFAPAARPTNEELERVYVEGGYKVNPVKEHFKTGWNNAKKWLCEAGLTDQYGTRIIKAETIKVDQMFDSVDAGKPVRSMGCVETEAEKVRQVAKDLPDALKQACNQIVASIGMEVPKTSPLEYCCSCGELLSGMRVWVENKVYCFNCDQKLRGYKPTDNDFQAEDDVPIGYLMEKPFDQSAFKLEVIENIIEMSGLRHAPKEIALEMISGIIGS